MPRESLRTSLGDVESQIHGRPGYVTRYERAILEQLADVAARNYQKLPSKIADRVPLQQFVAEEVKKMLGTLSHNVTPQAQQNLINIKRQQDQEEAQKRYENKIKARNAAILQYTKSKIPRIGPTLDESLKLVQGKNLGQLKVEATKIKKALGFPVTGVIDKEFSSSHPMRIRAQIHDLQRRYESDYIRDHPELREEAETSIPPVPPLESFTDSASRGETFDPMVRQALKDNFSLGQQEIKAGFDQGTKHTRDMILGKTLGVGESPIGQAREISDYLSDKNRYMGQAIYEEMSENYLNNILPKANLGFMKGAWNSPLRRSHNDRVLSNLHKDIVRTRMGMEAKTAEKGLEEAGQQQTRQLYSAKGAADMLNQQQQEATRAAETLANIEKTKVGADLAKIEAARLIGGEEQALEGSKLQETQNEALRQQENDMYMLEKQMGISRGIPASSFATQQQIMQQPNYAAIGAGGIGSIASSMMFGQQPPQTRKSGGLINKYAPGGIVLPNVENDPQAQLIEQEAQSLLNQQYDPQQALLHSIAKAGDKIQERYTGMPGIAGDMADTHLAHKEAQEVKRARGLNLMQQIHASRIKQQEFLAEMDYKNRTLGETSRHHRTMEEIGREQKSKLKLNQADQQILKDANKALSGSEDLLTELDKADGLLEKIDTGDWSTQNALTKSPYIQGMISKGEQADYDEFDKIYDDFANKSALAFGSKAGARVVEYLRKAKPHRGMSKEAIRNINANLRHMIEQEQQKAFYVNEGLEKGIAPTSALSEFVKSSSDKRKDGKSTEDKTSESRDISQASSDEDISQKSVAELRKIAGLE